MDVFGYLDQYRNTSFKESPFNNVDAMIMALISYFPFNYLKGQKLIYSAKDILRRIKTYEPKNKAKRKLKEIELINIVCSSKRYEGIKFANFEKSRSKLTEKQFQAITLVFKDFIFISFGGTDATTLGWKEDLNMSYMDIVPGEVDAIKYANKMTKLFARKLVYLGGHSKGGRLAIRAAKSIQNDRKTLLIYDFDGPNFLENFYDEKWLDLLPKIRKFTPEESIIGRLMFARDQERIVVSNAKLLSQHDLYTWEIEGTDFKYAQEYTTRTTKLVNSLNNALIKYDDETKKIFVDAVFDLLDRLDISEFGDTKFNLILLKNAISNIKIEWKNTPKSERVIIISMLLTIISGLLRK